MSINNIRHLSILYEVFTGGMFLIASQLFIYLFIAFLFKKQSKGKERKISLKC